MTTIDERDPRTDGERFLDLVDEISFRHMPNHRLICRRDRADPAGRWYFQIECPTRRPASSPRAEEAKAYLSPHATDSELVRCALGLLLAYVEHEAREAFEFMGAKVFGPHLDVLALVGVADRLDVRS